MQSNHVELRGAVLGAVGVSMFAGAEQHVGEQTRVQRSGRAQTATVVLEDLPV